MDYTGTGIIVVRQIFISWENLSKIRHVSIDYVTIMKRTKRFNTISESRNLDINSYKVMVILDQ
jgi:hypothetical protein